MADMEETPPSEKQLNCREYTKRKENAYIDFEKSFSQNQSLAQLKELKSIKSSKYASEPV